MSAKDAVVREALTWIGTPFHDRATVKGHGVDCAMLLRAVFRETGLVPEFEMPEYSPQHHLHSRVPLLEQTLQRFAHRVDRPLPGDVVVYKFGHVHHHAAIVVEWPQIVHAYKSAGSVVLGDGDQGELAGRDPRFYSVFPE
jgi:cell wall-associated NlpC family hydrolase